MVSNKLGEGIGELKFRSLFKMYIASRIKNKSISPIAVWDFDMKKLNLEELGFRVVYLIMDFPMMRKLQSTKFLMDADIIVIDDFSTLPSSVIGKLVSNIIEKKIDYICIFGDQKSNCHNVSYDIFDSMVHFVVKN